MRLISKLVKLLGIPAIAIALMLSITAGSANAAYPNAYNYRTQELSAYPTWGMASAFAQRDIFLASGNYGWQHYENSACTGMIYIAAGNYTWKDELKPIGGAYFHTISLIQGGRIIYSFPGCTWYVYLHMRPYTWGSILDPLTF